MRFIYITPLTVNIYFIDLKPKVIIFATTLAYLVQLNV